jgi:amino acid adenylation domain-containing protein
MSAPLHNGLSPAEKRARLERMLREKAAQARAIHPASHGQKALWLLHQTDPGSAAYNTAFAARIRSEPDPAALRRVCQMFVDRHPALRTTFELRDGEPVQVVHGERAAHFDEIDAAGWSEDELARAVAASYQRPFDLAHGPLFRAALFSRAAGDHVLLLSFHHIVCDAWSIWALLDEFRQLYPAVAAARAAALPPPPVTFAEYVARQRQLLAGPEGKQLVAYWKSQLAGDLPALDFTPLARGEGEGAATHFFALPPGLWEELKTLARSEKVTLFTVVLAAFQTLLHRCTGHDDLVVGTPTTGRDGSEFSRVVGYFVNPVPLRARFEGDPPFAEFLRQANQTRLDALAHAALPFPLLVEKLQPPREPGRAPIFQAMFVFQKPQESAGLADLLGPGAGRIAWGGLEVEPFPLAQMEGQFDLTLEVFEGSGCALKYKTALFDEAAVGRMTGHFVRMLAAVAANPGRRVSELPLLAEEERRELLFTWNATGADYPQDRCLHELIEAQVARTPEAPCLEFEDERLNYRELNERANRVAHELRARGAGVETLVGICVERSVEMVAGLLGILKAGAAYVPLDPSYPAERLAFMQRDSGVALLLTQRRFAPQLAASGAQILCLDEPLPDSEAARANPASGAAPGNAAYMIYTSGSTGKPKGALNTHRGICNRLLWMQDRYRLAPEDCVLQKTPFSFDVSVWEFFWPLLAGARLVVARPGGHQDRDYLAELIASRGVTTLHFVPSMLQLFLDGDVEKCAPLRQVFCSGEALPHALQERFFARSGAELHNLYGPTEAAVDVTFWPCERGGALRTVPIGRPIARTQIYILDRHLGPVPVGVAGELFIGGEGLARGYWKRPALTAERFIPNPFGAPGSRLYRTGDSARFLPGGAIEYLGRLDHQVKVRGFRVELGEIEAALAAHPAVREAVVTAADERLVACVVPLAGQAPGAAELRRFLQASLPDYMLPAAFVFLSALPLGPNGKLDRRALPAPGADGRAGVESAYEPPRGEAERIIGDIWKEVLQIEKAGIDDNFFELGGHSLLLARVHERLQQAFGARLALAELFRFPTIRSLARHLGAPESAAAEPPRAAVPTRQRGDIAIIGLACRFPGADSPEEFWRNLRDGVESVTFFEDAELLAAGVDPALVARRDYVKANAVVRDIERFDAAFFGCTPREAELLDPQQRLFLECAWQAIEDAGFLPRPACRCGVYAGAGLNTYLLRHLAPNRAVMESAGAFQLLLASDKDFLATRVSYKLGLDGPGVTVQTACSTSLVAVHLACQALLAGECDAALAGGVSVRLPQDAGYLHEEGMIFSPDGHCRAFDAKAAGIVGGNGAGVVVLKRLSDALAAGDCIRAVIRGSAINNDGAEKMGFTAPGAAGQEAVIARALAVAEVEPASIGYVEAHGTGTPLGDPVEIAALTRAFGPGAGACAIGSVKTNIGHLDTAAGVAGLIKTVLALEHGAIPPSLHFEAPNPQIDFAGGPFRVASHLAPWPRNATPRRAGVSSFGIGGTNAHVVLEEAPARKPAGKARPVQLLALSARSEPALAGAAANLARRLQEEPEIDLADAAFTLACGRRAFACRRAVVAASREEAIAALAAPEARTAPDAAPDVVFMFPGQGSQHAGMGAELYAHEPFFREQIDRCAELLRPHLGLDLRAVLYPRKGTAPAGDLTQTSLAQPALFAVSYALARLWMEWGVRPAAMIGHSLGEYVAACVAGVFSLEDALALVALRGQLMQSAAPGRMLAVMLPEADALARLGSELSLAAVNGAAASVLSGPAAAVEAIERELAASGVGCIPLTTSHAFHSAAMEPILGQFAEAVARIAPRPPQIPFVSNVTGTWITPAEVADPRYWATHLRRTVRFSDGLATLLAREPAAVLLEAGPGRTLAGLAARHPAKGARHAIVASLGREASSLRAALAALGELWMAGVAVDWERFHAREGRQRVPLPGHPFQRERFWIEPPGAAPSTSSSAAPAGRKAFDDWFLVPSWRRAPLPPAECEPARWLLLADDAGLADALASRLEQAGHDVLLARIGTEFRQAGPAEFFIDPAQPEHYAALIEAAGAVAGIVHFWSLTPAAPAGPDWAQTLGFHSLLALAQELGRRDFAGLKLLVVSDGLAQIAGEPLCPEKATLLGPARVIPREFPGLRCRCIDFSAPATDRDRARIAAQLCRELRGEAEEAFVAWRGSHRWVEAFEPVSLPEAPVPLKRGGVYLITGGLGGLGFVFAQHLARDFQAKLILTGRSPVSGDATGERIRKLQALEAAGAECLALAADAASEPQMHAAISRARERFGAIDGVIHAAGLPASGAIGRRDRAAAEAVLAPKLAGTLVLERVLGDAPLDFFMLTSSISAFLGEFGQADYCAANAFLDAFAQSRADAGRRVISINWDAWEEEGMAARVARAMPEIADDLRPRIRPGEGIDAFRRILAGAHPRVAVATHDLALYQARQIAPSAAQASPLSRPAQTARHARTEEHGPFSPPQDADEEAIAGVWEEMLGIQPIGRGDDFFALGGHSLLATQVLARLRERCGVTLGLAAFFEAPTVSGLAREMAARSQTRNGEPALAPTARGGRLPLSHQQEALWLLDRMEGTSAHLNELGGQMICGPLNAGALRDSLREIVRRHEALRTRFPEKAGELAQEIAAKLDLDLPLIDLTAASAAEQEAGVRRLAAGLVAEPFDLASGPLLRMALVRLGPARHAVLTVVHHIVFDGWSSELFFREMLSIYGALERGAPPELPALTVQYADYAAWQREMLRGERRARLERFWQGQLGGALPVLALPADAPRPRGPTFAGKRLAWSIEAPLTRRLEALARAQDASVFMVALASYGILLGRYTGQEEVIVGCPAAGRERREIEALIGFFVNPLPMRLSLSGNPRFSELLARVRRTVLDAYEHQALPFELIVEAVQPPREPGRHPIFQTLLIHQNATGAPVAAPPGLSVEPLVFEEGPARSDLDLYLQETPDGLRGHFIYNTALFAAETASRLAQRWCALLESVADSPDGRLAELRLNRRAAPQLWPGFTVGRSSLQPETGRTA